MGGEATVPAVFLGIVVDKKRKNPFTPNALRLRFALANGYKYIVLAGSQTEIIHKIISTSIDISQPNRHELLDFWETTIKESIADRKIRHIVTGNVLQAFGEYHGKLVSYTTLDGETKKGILMSEYWEPQAEGKQEIIVPLSRAIKVIRSITVGSAITTNAGISIFRTSSHFKIMVAAARSKGGDIYLDEDILKLVNRNIFEKVSDKMTALLELDSIDRLVKILEEKHGDAIALNQSQYEMIPKSAKKRERPPLSKPIPTIPTNTTIEITDQLELEALALELELQLLNFAA